MEGKITVVRFLNLTKEEQDFLNSVERKSILKKKEDFMNDPRYEGVDP